MMNTLHKPGRRSRILAGLLLSCAFTSAWAWEPGRMTGGGSIICPAPIYRVTFGYELHCQLENNPPSTPNNLEVNFSGGDNFHLTQLTQSVCSLNGSPTPPTAPFNTMNGEGTGTFNGRAAAISFILVDNGEPGANHDTAKFVITTAGGSQVLNCGPRLLEGGDNQAHRATGSKP
jgi:hypothetical protein